MLEKLNDGMWGAGCQDIIKDIYKYCSEQVQDPEDQVWLFGFSREAYIVRAVSALLGDGLYRQPPSSSAWKAAWRDRKRFALKKTKTHKGGQMFRYRCVFISSCPPPPGPFPPEADSLRRRSSEEMTSWAPVIKFVGLFDTVQMTLDWADLDISHADSIKVVRHALALNEEKSTRPLLLYDSSTVVPDSDIVQAWFVGRHADIGGSTEQDGLSLYPLQWMLNESQKHGLVLEHRADGTRKNLIENPLSLVFPSTVPLASEPTTNGESGHEQQVAP